MALDDLARLEWAVTVMAAAIVVQTVVLLAGVVWGLVTYKRLAARAGREFAALHATLDEVSDAAKRSAEAVGRGTDAVGAVVDDARRAAQTVAIWTGTVATALHRPRTTAALGVLRGVQWWRGRRARARNDSGA